MKYKAVFIDVDGTLMPHGIGNLPSMRVRAAIKHAQDRGVSVCLATSRPMHALGKLFTEVPFHGYCVITGGAQLYDASAKKIIRNIYLPRERWDEVLAVGKQYKLKTGYFDGIHDRVWGGGALPDRVIGWFFPEIPPESTAAITRILEKIPSVAVHRMPAWDERYDWIDITSEEATKLHGIVDVAKRLGIDTSEMIGIGDGYNDFPLLLACGLKVAMGNAVKELKDIADYIAPSVEDDGVADVIERFIL